MAVHEREIIVRVDGGLHARPISEVVRISKGFKAKVSLLANGKEALTASSLKMLMLGVREGEPASLRGTGEDADEAIAALARYLECAGADPVGVASDLSSPVDAEASSGVSLAGPGTGASSSVGGEGRQATGPETVCTKGPDPAAPEVLFSRPCVLPTSQT